MSSTPEWLVDLLESVGVDRKDSGIDRLFNETNVVKADRFDKRLYAETHDLAEELRNLADKRRETELGDTWADLIQDEFLGLWKADPQLRPESEIRPDRVLNRAVINRAQQDRAWAELRTYTELDQWLATMAAVQFGEKLSDLFDEQNELREKQQEVQDAVAQAQSIIDGMEGGGDEGEGSVESLIDALEKLTEASEGLNRELSKDDVSKGIRQAVKKTLEETQDVEEALASYGTEPGELERMPAEVRIKLAARIAGNAKLKQLADKLGRMVRLAIGEQARKVIHAQDEVFDVTLGADLAHTVASEFAWLALPQTETLFYKKFVGRELLTYEMRGTEKIARGGIVALVDSSGSMRGDRETWAKAVAIALLHIAKKQKRDFMGAIFSSHGEMEEWMFKGGSAPVEKVLEFAESAFHGGTDFEYPLSRGVQILKEQFDDDGARKGDLVIITDGDSEVSSAWLEKFNVARHQMAFRLYGVHIGSYARTLDQICDTVWHISDLATGEDVRDIFGMV